VSDTPQGPDWFQASDGKWYPPAPQQPAKKKKTHGCLKAIGVVGGLFVVLIVIIAVAAGSSSKKTAKTASATCAGKTYPDHHKQDTCADLSNTVKLDGLTVRASPFTSESDAIGGKALCAKVAIRNTSSKSQDYNVLDFKVQTPSGDVATTSTLSLAGTLDSGTLIAGATKTGLVCTDNKGEKGKYIFIYKPNPFESNRGIWLFSV
jgi:hypothetical protein